MSNRCFTYAFKFSREKVTAYDEEATNLDEWQLALDHMPNREMALFESETGARQAVLSFLRPIVEEENTFYTPKTPVSCRWRVYKLEQADHGTIFWYKGKTVE